MDCSNTRENAWLCHQRPVCFKFSGSQPNHGLTLNSAGPALDLNPGKQKWINTLAPAAILKNLPLSQKCAFLYNFVMAMFNPQKTDYIIKVIGLIQLKDVPAGKHQLFPTETRKFFEDLRGVKGVRVLMDGRYNPKHPTLEELLTYPVGSLGYCFATHMKNHNLAQDFYVVESAPTDFLWFDQRMKKIHDILHVVYNFGIEVEGELGLQAVMVAQTASAVPGFIVSGGLLNLTFSAPTKLPRALAEVSRGFNLGMESDAFLGFRFEDYWEQPLAVVRQAMGINSCRSENTDGAVKSA